MTIAEELERRQLEAFEQFDAYSRRSFAESLTLSQDELMRRENEALRSLVHSDPAPWDSAKYQTYGGLVTD